MLIEFETTDGKPIGINPDKVMLVRPEDEATTTIEFEGEELVVKGNVKATLAAFRLACTTR